MKCQAACLLLVVASSAMAVAADPASEVAEIRRLLEARGERLDARTLDILKSGHAADLAVLRRQIQHAPAPRQANIGQGVAGKKAATARKLQSSGKLNSTRKL